MLDQIRASFLSEQFLQERQSKKVSSKNWLIFGDRNAATDYLYREEIEADKLVIRLDLAFCRDQQEKIDVQVRMRENAEELFDWLEQGGSFFVCGEASNMAKDAQNI